jgi:hypothetical protein
MPSDAASAFIELVADRPVFPDEAARDLMRLLGSTLVERDYASRRWDVLGPLVVLIVQRDGSLPTVREYENHRATRSPSAPSASALTKRYGTWLSALNAASQFMTLSRRSPVQPYKTPRHAPYTPAECLGALAYFHKRFGEWPRPSEYREWSRSTRRAARETGAKDPCLPDLKVILKRFGTFDRALSAAESIYGADT